MNGKYRFALASVAAFALMLGMIGTAAAATGGSGGILASVNVPASVCGVTLDNTAIAFSPITPGVMTLSTPTNNAITITNSGNIAGEFFVSGSSWVGAGTISPPMGAVSWTSYSTDSGATFSPLSGTASDLGSINALGIKGVDFGLTVPINTAAGTYHQTITVTSTC